MKFKYVGSGPTPPEKTNFMGKVKFKLKGKAVDVTDPMVIEKLKGSKCFKIVKEAPRTTPATTPVTAPPPRPMGRPRKTPMVAKVP